MQLTRYHRYGDAVNSHDLTKFFAILLMFVDHIGLYFYPEFVWLRIIGRLAAPLFFFLVGYSGNYRFNPSILIYGLGLTILYSLIWKGHIYINVLINFTLIKLILDHYDPDTSHGFNLLTLFLLLSLGAIFTIEHFEYGTLGVLFGVAGRLCSRKNPNAFAWLTGTLVSYVMIQIFAFRLFHFAYLLGIWGVGLVLLLYLWFYHKHDYPIDGAENHILRFVSRYSLEIYSLQLLLIFVIRLIMEHHTIFVY